MKRPHVKFSIYSYKYKPEHAKQISGYGILLPGCLLFHKTVSDISLKLSPWRQFQGNVDFCKEKCLHGNTIGLFQIVC